VCVCVIIHDFHSLYVLLYREVQGIFTVMVYFANRNGFSVKEKLVRVVNLLVWLYVFIFLVACVWLVSAHLSDDDNRWIEAYTVPGMYAYICVVGRCMTM
jgi:hypothetical protein